MSKALALAAVVVLAAAVPVRAGIPAAFGGLKPAVLAATTVCPLPPLALGRLQPIGLDDRR